MKTTHEEIANIIFNSDESELNDIVLEAQKLHYPAGHLIKALTIDINTTSSNILHDLLVETAERKRFLKERIRYEMGLLLRQLKEESRR